MIINGSNILVEFNSLAPGRCGCYLKSIIFELISRRDNILRITCEIAFIWGECLKTSSVQFNSLFGLKLFPKNTIQIHTYKHKKWRVQVQRIWTQLQFNGTTKSLSHKSTFHNLAPLIREEKNYSVHTELINTSISSLWNWGIYQWSARIFNKEHKSNPFPFSFSSVLAEFLLLTNFLFRPIGVLLKIAL